MHDQDILKQTKQVYVDPRYEYLLKIEKGSQDPTVSKLLNIVLQCQKLIAISCSICSI